jgi:hypothetical protein
MAEDEILIWFYNEHIKDQHKYFTIENIYLGISKRDALPRERDGQYISIGRIVRRLQLRGYVLREFHKFKWRDGFKLNPIYIPTIERLLNRLKEDN